MIIIDAVALIIALGSAIFTGAMWVSNSKEQKLRLRPQVYIAHFEPRVLAKSLDTDIWMANCGLLPAKIISVSGLCETDWGKWDIKQQTASHAMIVPNQTFKTGINLNISEGESIDPKHSIVLGVKITYTNGGIEYFYFVKNKYNPTSNKWEILDSDAN